MGVVLFYLLDIILYTVVILSFLFLARRLFFYFSQEYKIEKSELIDAIAKEKMLAKQKVAVNDGGENSLGLQEGDSELLQLAEPSGQVGEDNVSEQKAGFGLDNGAGNGGVFEAVPSGESKRRVLSEAEMTALRVEMERRKEDAREEKGLAVISDGLGLAFDMSDGITTVEPEERKISVEEAKRMLLLMQLEKPEKMKPVGSIERFFLVPSFRRMVKRFLTRPEKQLRLLNWTNVFLVGGILLPGLLFDEAMLLTTIPLLAVMTLVLYIIGRKRRGGK